jgi:hypothetical protein
VVGVGDRSRHLFRSPESSRADMSPLEKWVVSRGTDGSNPVPSSGESANDLWIGVSRDLLITTF